MRARENLENLQVKLIAGGRDLDKAKRFLERCAFVGLTEKFDLSLRVLEGLSPWKLQIELPATSGRRKQHSEGRVETGRADAGNFAREYNKLDLELYQFAVDEIFPRLCQKAGVNPADKVPVVFQRCAEGDGELSIEQGSTAKCSATCANFGINVLFRDPRPRMGNTAEDIFGPLAAERDPGAPRMILSYSAGFISHPHREGGVVQSIQQALRPHARPATEEQPAAAPRLAGVC